jgi:cell division protein FtsB
MFKRLKKMIVQSSKYVVLNVLFLVVLSYLMYHLILGERGIFAKWQLKQDHQVVQQKLEDVQAARIALEHKVQSLRPETLDLDLIEEQVRKNTNLGRAEDVIILLDPGAPPPGQPNPTAP